MVAGVSVSFRRGLLLLTWRGWPCGCCGWGSSADLSVADETMWLTAGTQLLPSPEVAFSPLRLRFIFHPPLYVYFVGLVSTAFGTLEAVKYAQCLLGVTLVPALALLGRRFSGERAGLLAAGIAALYPELVWFSSHFWAEVIFSVLLWWALERLAAADESGTGDRRLSGALFGSPC